MALQSQATLLTGRVSGQSVPTVRGYYPLRFAISITNCTGIPLRDQSQTTIRQPGAVDFHIELIPLHSPLLGESLLVSFPPLSNMLKSSGSSSQSEARKGRSCDRVPCGQHRYDNQDSNDLSPCGATTLVSRCVFGELSLHFGRHSERRTPMLGLPKLPPRAA